jgi:hypothetical protein
VLGGGDKKQLHDERLHDRCSLFIRVIRSRRISWADYIACTGVRNTQLQNMKGRDHLRYLCIHTAGCVILIYREMIRKMVSRGGL